MDLIKPGSSVPAFTLPDAQTGRRIEYGSFLRKRRIIILLLNDAGREWFAGATKQAREFAERDLTVLAIARSAEKPGNLPAGFHLLLDENSVVAERLGGTPAFYLIGKDTGIKSASRTFPTPAELFRTIDSMPMRAQEARERGE
ncbi:MAG: DUF4174 domain-containing protein [Akkermansiaceae bacterium]|nr:DUF4174 domain-containing protein [Armatimonadota bacterium]